MVVLPVFRFRGALSRRGSRPRPFTPQPRTDDPLGPMADPVLILLDEPGAGVNPTLMRSLVSAIRGLHARGMTFLLIEHDMDLITEPRPSPAVEGPPP